MKSCNVSNFTRRKSAVCLAKEIVRDGTQQINGLQPTKYLDIAVIALLLLQWSEN